MQGVEAKHSNDSVYILPIHIFSQDAGDAKRRCGRLTFCRKRSEKWFGYTAFHLFTATWNNFSVVDAREPFFDTKAEVRGKSCFRFEWATEATYDITEDANAMKDVQEIGVVVASIPEEYLVEFELFESFTNSTSFQTQGIWRPVSYGLFNVLKTFDNKSS